MCSLVDWKKPEVGSDVNSSSFTAAENTILGMSSYHVLRGLWDYSVRGKAEGKRKTPSSHGFRITQFQAPRQLEKPHFLFISTNPCY